MKPVPEGSFVSDLVLEPADNERLANLCGQFDENLKQIERRLGVEIRSRGNRMQALGRGGLLGMQVYGQAAGQQQNRLIEEAKKLQQQQALASLKPREGGGFTTDRMADLLWAASDS